MLGLMEREEQLRRHIESLATQELNRLKSGHRQIVEQFSQHLVEALLRAAEKFRA